MWIGEVDYVDCGTSSSLDSLNNNLTISIWLYNKQDPSLYPENVRTPWEFYKNLTEWILMRSSDIGLDNMYIYNNINNANQPLQFTLSSVGTNIWEHWVAVFNDNNLALYKNGIFIQSLTLDPNFSRLPDGFKFNIGKCSADADRYWNGSIDDVMIFNRSLSEIEIQGVYDSQIARYCPTPLNVYYVSVNGDDNNSGTFDEPFATIQKAKDMIWNCARDGITVYIREGTYYLNETLEFNREDSGSFWEPNIYKAYFGEEVVIKGSKRIPASEFSTYFGNIMQANLSSYGIDEFYHLFMNRKRLIPARYPNYDPNEPITGGWLWTAENSTNGIIKYEEGDIDPTGWNVENSWVDVFAGPNYGNYIIKINSIDPADKIIYTAISRVEADNRYNLQHIFQELDSENEWYFDINDKILYLYPEHTLMENDEITIPVAINIILFNGVNHIKFEGIDIEESWLRDPRSDFVLPSRGKGNCIYIKGSEYIDIDNCKISNSGSTGFYILDSMNITIKNSEIFSTGREGIYARDNLDYFKQLINTNYLFTNNSIHDTGEIEMTNGGGGGITATTVGTVISKNYFYNIPGNAVLLSGGNDNIVEYNEVQNVNLEVQDTGSLYFIPYKCYNRGHVFRYNFVNGSGGLCQYDGQLYFPCYSWGIYLDAAGSGVSMYGNTIIDTKNSNIFINGGRDNIIENNTFVENRDTDQIEFGQPCGDGSLWAGQLANMEANGYNSTLYYEKYPELFNIRADLTADELLGYNIIRNNLFIYPERDTHLYDGAGFFDLNTNEFNDNIIWQGHDPVTISIKGLTWNQWLQLGHDNTSRYLSDIFGISIYNNFSDDYELLINTEHEDKEFILDKDMCDLDNNVVLGSVNLEPFESRVLYSCFCNNDVACNNRETIESCPADCTETCVDGMKNQDETDVDCGRVICNVCNVGESCILNLDCLSVNCVSGICEPANYSIDYVSYWKFEREIDGEIIDESLRNPGILIDNATIINDAERGQVLELDGVTDSVEINERISLDYSQNFTVLGWIYRKESRGMKTIFSREGYGLGWGLSVEGDYFIVYANINGTWTIYNRIRSGLLRGQWQHIAFVFNSSNNMIFYVDGELKAVRKANGTIFYSATHNKFSIGDHYYWNGTIDDVMIFNRSLSEIEILDIYNAQKINGALPSLSIFSGILNWFKGFLTGNTIKEITGRFIGAR